MSCRIRIAQQVAQVVEHGARDFLGVKRQRVCLKKQRRPQAAAHQGQCIGKGGERFGIPRRLTEQRRRTGQLEMGQEGDHREKSEEGPAARQEADMALAACLVAKEQQRRRSVPELQLKRFDWGRPVVARP